MACIQSPIITNLMMASIDKHAMKDAEFLCPTLSFSCSMASLLEPWSVTVGFSTCLTPSASSWGCILCNGQTAALQDSLELVYMQGCEN